MKRRSSRLISTGDLHFRAYFRVFAECPQVFTTEGNAENRDTYRTRSRGNTDFPPFIPSRTRAFGAKVDGTVFTQTSPIQSVHTYGYLYRNAKMKINKEQEDPPESC